MCRFYRKEGSKIIDVASEIGIKIPKLCFLKDINEIGACRICSVEVEGTNKLLTSCNNVVEEGMVIKTNSPKVRKARRTNIELLLSQHDFRCATCVRSGNCSLQEIANNLGIGSGAGVIFGATGGVMEAALRSAYYFVTGENPSLDAFESVRGQQGWRDLSFSIVRNQIDIAVVSGLRNARNLLEALKRGKVKYDFVEVMACPGGCAGGGGQPIKDGCELAGKRIDKLYNLDKEMSLRYSHENPAIQKIYSDYFDKANSELAHKLLHTDHFAWSMALSPVISVMEDKEFDFNI